MNALRLILPDWSTSRLQRRFALVSGVLLTTISLLFLVVLTQVYRDQILAEHTRASVHINRLLQSALENAMVKRDLDGLQAIVEDLAAQEGIAQVRIVAPDGEVRFASDPTWLHRVLPDQTVAQALASGRALSALVTPSGGTRVVRSVNPVHNQARCIGCHGAVEDQPINGLLVVDYDATGLRGAVLRGVLLLGALGLAVMLAVQAGLWVTLRRLVLNRANDLDATAQALAGGDLSARAPAGEADELMRLGGSFNSMAARIEAQLQDVEAQKQFLQAMIDAIPDGVRVIGPDFRVVMVNQAFRDLHGLGQDSCAGAPCYALSHGRSAPCVPTLVQCPVVELYAEGPQRMKCQHRHQTAQGQTRAVEVFAARTTMRIDGAEQPCVVESIRDLEAQGVISQEQRLAEMGMLAAGLAHEVFNPLSSVSLVLDALESQPLDARGRDHLEVARSEIRSCQRVTESLLRMAAPGRDVPEQVDFAAVLRDTARLLTLEATQRDCSIHVEAEGDCTMIGRESDLRMLVFNLTQNAIHAMPDGGPVTLSCVRKGALIALQVTDQGVGIAPEDQARVMMPFWTHRADGSQGRGLGLWICSGITTRMGTALRLTSTLGQGSCFAVDLPVTPPTMRPPEDTP